MTDSLQQWLTQEIREILARQTLHVPFIVWCDPDRSWLDLLRAASIVSGFELSDPAAKVPDFQGAELRNRMFNEERRPNQKRRQDKTIADRAEWRADERRWVRQGKLPQPGWWPTNESDSVIKPASVEQR